MFCFSGFLGEGMGTLRREWEIAEQHPRASLAARSPSQLPPRGHFSPPPNQLRKRGVFGNVFFVVCFFPINGYGSRARLVFSDCFRLSRLAFWLLVQPRRVSSCCIIRIAGYAIASRAMCVLFVDCTRCGADTSCSPPRSGFFPHPPPRKNK